MNRVVLPLIIGVSVASGLAVAQEQRASRLLEEIVVTAQNR